MIPKTRDFLILRAEHEPSFLKKNGPSKKLSRAKARAVDVRKNSLLTIKLCQIQNKMDSCFSMG